MKKLFVFVVVFSLICFGGIPRVAGADRHPWEIYQVQLTARTQYENPYTEGLPSDGPPLVQARFHGVSGECAGLNYTVHGFWNGGRTWCIRFAPPAPGVWRYETTSPDPALTRRTGRFSVLPWNEHQTQTNPTRRGFIRVHSNSPRAGRYFEYADGTPFLWIGDTWWNWTKREIRLESFRRLVDDRAEKGFTVGQLFVAGNGWSRSISLLDETFTHPDIPQLQRVDSMITYANSRGITVWVHGWWTREDMNERIGPENIRRWWRYLVDRLSAYNVMWVLAGEYNMYDYGGMGLEFWQDLGRRIEAEDPYQRVISAHPTPPGWAGGADAPQWSTGEVLHGEPWLDYNQSQVGHGRWRNEMIPRVVASDYQRKPAKPVVVTEPWYEFIRGYASAQDIRFGAWSAILSGAAGHSYGGGHVWKAHVPESPAGEDAWPMEMDFDTNTLDYPGAQSMGILSHFLSRIDWWSLEPHPELVSEYPAPYCAAVPGREYLVYLRYGGTLKLSVQAAGKDRQFTVQWLNPGTGDLSKGGTVTGGGIQTFTAPGGFPAHLDFQDWVLFLRAAPAPFGQ